MVDWHSLSWKNRAGKLSPARVLTITLPNHHPILGGLTSNEYISLTGTAKAYVPMELACDVVTGGGGTRYDCFGGAEVSERSTLTYVSYASPREDSGTQASNNEDAWVLRAEDEDVGRASPEEDEDFCCTRAMKPGILSLADGVGCTYTWHCIVSLPRHLTFCCVRLPCS